MSVPRQTSKFSQRASYVERLGLFFQHWTCAEIFRTACDLARYRTMASRASGSGSWRFRREKTDPPASPGPGATPQIIVTSPHQGPDGQLMRHPLPRAARAPPAARKPKDPAAGAPDDAFLNRHATDHLGGAGTPKAESARGLELEGGVQNHTRGERQPGHPTFFF